MKRVIAMCAAFVLSACGGGGGGGDNSSDALLDDFDAQVAGGSREVGTVFSSAQKSQFLGCSFVSYRKTRAQIQSDIQAAGGTVTASTDERICGTIAGDSNCMIRFGDTFVLDRVDSGIRLIDLYITGIPNGRYAGVEFASVSFDADANLYAAQTDNSITAQNVDNCTNTQPTQPVNAVNGDWRGTHAAYNPITKTGSDTLAQMTCVNQACVIPGYGTFILTQISTTGIWEGTNGNEYIRAAIARDAQTLALYSCETPYDESQIFSKCDVFGFSR